MSRCLEFLADEQATVALGQRMALSLPTDVKGWLILLQGDLGAGKSTLARALLHKIGHRGAVPSPTYTLVEPYEIEGRKIYHIDLYRISDADELDFLGWSELEDGLALVEWPERVPQLAQTADVIITLSYAQDGRQVELELCSDRARALPMGHADQCPHTR